MAGAQVTRRVKSLPAIGTAQALIKTTIDTLAPTRLENIATVTGEQDDLVAGNNIAAAVAIVNEKVLLYLSLIFRR